MMLRMCARRSRNYFDLQLWGECSGRPPDSCYNNNNNSNNDYYKNNDDDNNNNIIVSREYSV